MMGRYGKVDANIHDISNYISSSKKSAEKSEFRSQPHSVTADPLHCRLAKTLLLY